MSISKKILYLQISTIFFLSCLFFAQTAYALSIVATIPVGTSPQGVAYDSGKNKVYVANNGGTTVSVIDDTTNTLFPDIPVGSSPQGVAYDSGKNKIYVANSASNTVSVIDDTTDTVIATIPVGTSPQGVTYDSGQNKIYVANGGGTTVTVIDDTTDTIITDVTVGSAPVGVAYDSGQSKIYVANNGGTTVSVIDDTTDTVLPDITVGTAPFGVAYDSGQNKVYVSNSGDNTVSVIDDTTNTVLTTIPVGGGPVGVTYDPATGEILVANSGDNTVSLIDDTTDTVTTTLTVGATPFGTAFDAGKNEIFVTNTGDNTVSVLSEPASPGSSLKTPDVRIHHPPSLGNDYYYHYDDGVVINGKSFDITKWGVTIPQQVLQIGQPANFTFKIYDERGGSTVSHVGMYIHFKGDTSVTNSDTSIVWDKHDGTKVSDPGKLFSNTFVSEHYDDHFAYVSIEFTPSKAMPDSAILMRMWDEKLASIDLPIQGAIIIVDPNAPVPVTKVPDNQYGDYKTLVSLLDSDGYEMPSILHRIRSGSDLSSVVNVYWIYDKGNDNLTMVQTFKDGTMIGDTVFTLFKKQAEPTVTDHDYADIPIQNNRQNPEQEKAVMVQEELKAVKILEAMHVITK